MTGKLEEEGGKARALSLAWVRVQEARTYYSRTIHVGDALKKWSDYYPDFMKEQELYDAVKKMQEQFRAEHWRADEMVSEAFKETERLKYEQR